MIVQECLHTTADDIQSIRALLEIDGALGRGFPRHVVGFCAWSHCNVEANRCPSIDGIKAGDHGFAASASQKEPGRHSGVVAGELEARTEASLPNPIWVGDVVHVSAAGGTVSQGCFRGYMQDPSGHSRDPW